MKEIRPVATVADFCVIEVDNKLIDVETLKQLYPAVVVDNSGNMEVQVNGIDCMMSEDDFYLLYDDMVK